ncbi:MAG: hypothetical protein RIQ88_522 [Actinomycetota bacterium]
MNLTETILGLLRHGQTDWNVELRLQGTSDIELNETGIAQARVAASKIHRSDWDIILSSPLMRAKVTAEIIAEQTGLEVVLVPDLVERSFGEGEGLSHPEWRKIYESGQQIPGLETVEQLTVRARSLLSLASTHYDGKRILAVTHGAYIRTVLRLASDKKYPGANDRLGNVSLSRLMHLDGLWQVIDYNPNSLAS